MKFDTKKCDLKFCTFYYGGICTYLFIDECPYHILKKEKENGDENRIT